MAEIVNIGVRSSRQNTEIQIQGITQEKLITTEISLICESSRNFFGLLLSLMPNCSIIHLKNARLCVI